MIFMCINKDFILVKYRTSTNIIRKKLKTKLNKNYYLKSKVLYLNKKLGKTNTGQLVCFYREIGVKYKYRQITNYRIPLLNCGIIEQFEYNPRTYITLARIYNSILNYHFYIRASKGIKIGFMILTLFNKQPLSHVGDCTFLFYLKQNKPIHNITLNGKNNISRSTGTFSLILQKYKNITLIRFPSKNLYYLSNKHQATLGKLGNKLKKLIEFGKAGRKRWLGWRPHVRGVAMNPIDHPHGGGNGKTSGGCRTSVSPWGKPTKQIKKKIKNNDIRNKSIFSKKIKKN